MKKLLGCSALIVLILSVAAGCMNPFSGGSGDGSGRAAPGADEVIVNVEILAESHFGPSSIYDEPDLEDGQHYWVELDVFNSAGRRIVETGMEKIDGVYRANLSLQPGLLTFVVSSRVYTWDTDVSDYRYYGEVEQQINSGVTNTVTIATSSYDLLCSIVEINNIPAGYESVIIGLVEDGFDLYGDIIGPYRASGFSDRALMSIISQVWIAFGDAQLVADSSKPGYLKAEARLMREVGSARPWQQEGTYNVFVMLRNELDMWVPGSVDVHGSFTPFNGSTTFSAGGDYFGATGLFTANHYRAFHYLIAEEGGVIIDIEGILKQGGEPFPPEIMDEFGGYVSTAGTSWAAAAALFPRNWNVFDEEGNIAEDAHPIALGSAIVDLNYIGFDGKASVPLLMHYEDGGDVGDLRIPWMGTIGNEYDVYVLLSPFGEEEQPMDGTPMYIAGEEFYNGDRTFIPTAFVFTFEGVPERVSIDVTGLDFGEMPHANGNDD